MVSLDSFFGSGDRQVQDLTQANQLANQRLERGFDDFRDISSDFLGRSTSFLQPDIQAGTGARNQLLAALGVSGQDAQRDFFGNFQNDPGFNALLGAGVEALDASAASRGLLRSGGQQQALFDFGQRLQNQFFNDRLNRLTQLSNVGSSAGTNAASLTANTGQNIAGARFGLGQQLAANEINLANATAQARQQPLNNLLGLIGGVSGIAQGAAQGFAGAG